ncbi:MAG TPA: molybdenum cofactor guanylyltransferase [Niabella sp.]|nr:molybdenum cofactor guanylyltransferase [Niabella sp.]HQW14251.1 molybdenum cofactor guanylyltransferase [Niabella sp.]HQX19651.1 molybdenum cofactor guanylyltransferase [Niabella sp.]HQX39915.1 molybdenum cofactor guanylyltransferase [Niabella sp.]HRB06908.1 molybdenum cofactor guanylyltransferase [Niabella sp.]
MKACILSGGKSSRLGEDKGLKLIQGKSLVAHLLNTLALLNVEVFIVANDERYMAFGPPVVADIISGKGPLGGIYTGLNIAGEDLLVLSVDTPFLSADNIHRVYQQHKSGRLTVAFFGEMMQPLLAVYPYLLKNKLATQLKTDRLKLMQFVEESGYDKISIALTEIEQLNLNTPEDFVTAEKYFKYES